ncbi:dinucleotide-utilizing enzyme [Microbacterium thalassium]|uniref:Threonine dehydrogenase-like Zn-dependent dehydrogenase n=1 Tax=Microbacterium thalassium TaxID=362649 RepID=A0A7X0KV14_9MICO|nr:dinucleotide-utilizing enzyme [Microbacterium thalassium]MBB6391755.1 threonine dehydrogenase-like Zn-dependent dehydrogenase [Microbacterium thalassium]GLK24357.1 hypothetical protein GCM10017607_16750 [Microbacterium thalassium]
MTARPRLATRIPFWGLVVASLGSAAAGALILVDKLGVMTTTLTDGTATGIEVYVGQSMAVLGAVLIGAGVIGILLAFAIASLASLRPAAPAVVVEPIDWSAESADADEAEGDAPDHGYERGLGYTSQFEAVGADDAPAETAKDAADETADDASKEPAETR